MIQQMLVSIYLEQSREGKYLECIKVYVVVRREEIVTRQSHVGRESESRAASHTSQDSTDLIWFGL